MTRNARDSANAMVRVSRGQILPAIVFHLVPGFCVCILISKRLSLYAFAFLIRILLTFSREVVAFDK